MDTSYRLPKKKYPVDTATKYFLGFVIGLGGLVLVAWFFGLINDYWVFSHMTGAQHLWEAKKAAQNNQYDLALDHVSAISAKSGESAEAHVLQMELNARLAADKAAQDEKKAEAEARQQIRAASVSALGSDLQNLGYELKIRMSHNNPEEMVITSSEFTDTDHRVRFLSFLRSQNSLTFGVCSNGFSKVRLRSSETPLAGFDESYPLNCYAR